MKTNSLTKIATLTFCYSAIIVFTGCGGYIAQEPSSPYLANSNPWVDNNETQFIQWTPSGDLPWCGVSNLVVRRRWREALSALDTSSLDLYDKTFLRGYLLYKLEQYSSAKQVLLPFIDSLAGYELGDWARFYLADASFNSGDHENALSTAKTLGPLPGLKKEIAQLRWKPLVKKLRLSEAQAALDTLLQNGWLTRTEYDLYYGQVLYERGNTILAIQRIVPIVKQFPEGDVGLAAAHFLEKFVLDDNLLRWFIGQTYFKNNRWEQAIKWLKEYLEKGGAKYSSLARFYIAKSYMELKNYRNSLEYLRRLQKERYRLPWVFWAMARCYRKLNDYKKSEIFADSAFSLCGEDNSMCSTILLEKIFWARDKRDYEKLAKISSDHIKMFPDKTKSDIIALWGALSCLKVGDFDGAGEILSKSYPHFKDEDFKNEILFWQAYSSYLAGDTAYADSLWSVISARSNTHISRFWAEEALGNKLPKPKGHIPMQNFDPDSVFHDARNALAEYGKTELGFPDNAGDFLIRQQAIHLSRLGLITLSRNILTELEKKTNMTIPQRLALWRHYWDIGSYDLACIQGEKIARTLNTDDPRILKLWLIMPFQTLVDSIAKINDIDPYLVYSVMIQESRFFPWSGSPAGALGLMQIMPQTGKSIARRLKIPDFKEDNLRDYVLSLEMGIWFLKKLIDKHENISYALAEYNAGPFQLETWEKSCPIDDEKVYIEWCDYEQTRRYMKLIWARYYLYRLVWG